MTTKEMVGVLEKIRNKNYFSEGNTFAIMKIHNALSQAIEMTKRVEKIDLPIVDLAKIVLFIRRNMFLPENDKLAELNRMIKATVKKAMEGKC